jgi:hypothetical protein
LRSEVIQKRKTIPRNEKRSQWMTIHKRKEKKSKEFIKKPKTLMTNKLLTLTFSSSFFSFFFFFLEGRVWESESEKANQ